MRKTKRKFAQFTFFDRTGIQQMLEKEALKGWILEKISPFGWKFRRTERRKLHYAVTYFPQASAYEPGPSEEQQRMWEFCEHTGWVLAGYNAQMQIFYNENENPVPIETDPAIELENIEKSAKKNYLPSYYVLFGLGILQLVMVLYRFFQDPVSIMSTNGMFFSVFGWLTVLVMCAVEIVGYFIWRKKALRAIETDGSFVETKGSRTFQMVMLAMVTLVFVCYLSLLKIGLVIAVIISVVAVFVIGQLVRIFSEFLKKKNVSTAKNRAYTIIFTVVIAFAYATAQVHLVIWGIGLESAEERQAKYRYEFKGKEYAVFNNELPLEIDDLIDVDKNIYRSGWYGNESLFLGEHTVFQHPEAEQTNLPWLNYKIIKVKANFLYDIVAESSYKDFIKNSEYAERYPEMRKSAVEIPAEEWGANAVYQRYTGDKASCDYLLYYNDYIIVLYLEEDLPLNALNKAKIAEIFS